MSAAEDDTIFIELENHRIMDLGRDLWISSNPTSCSKWVQLDQMVQDTDQLSFEYLPRKKTP